MSNHSSLWGILRVTGVVAAMAVVMLAAVVLMHRRDVVRTFPEPLTSPAYFDDYYDDPATRPVNLVAGDRIPSTRNARR